MISSYRVKNLRAFKDSLDISLKPLTVFVGKNSSGKSTLTRILPLMRQSVEQDTKGPILWFGKYVDFDSFLTAKNKVVKEDTIGFCFSLDANKLRYFGRRTRRSRDLIDSRYEEGSVDVELMLTENQKRTSTMSVRLKSSAFEVFFERVSNERDSCELYFNSKSVSPNQYVMNDYSHYGIIPSVKVKRNEDRPLSRFLGAFDRISPYSTSEQVYSLTIFEEFKSHFHGTTAKDTILAPLTGVFFFTKDYLYHYLRRTFSEQTVFMRNLTEDREQVLDSALKLITCLNLNFLIDCLNEGLYKEFKSCSYLAPIRATAERFYRFQDLRVDELDHTGSNLVMLISSMTSAKRSMLSKWILENFEFDIRVTQNLSHYALEIKPYGSDVYHNISDMGFGFSQILPILISIWDKLYQAEKYGRFEGRSRVKEIVEETHVIEQPELHLHPDMQAILARVIARISGNKELNIRFVIETHSKTFLDSIGAALRANEIDTTDISLNLVETEYGTSCSSVRSVSFNENGQLKDWPVGFFSPQR